VWDTRAIDSVPLLIALTAGGLAVLNPCGFPLLPAFLSYYLGVEEQRLPHARTRVAQGLLVGGLVAVGCLVVFAVIALPLSLGVGAIADAVPWVGLATGAALALAGVGVLAGRRIPLPALPRPRVPRGRGLATMVLFGVGYGAASLGCTLPILLALIGSSLGAARLSVFAAYAAGMAVVLMSLSVAVAFAREGIARRSRPLLPHVARVAGVLLLASGAYLTYYWARVRFGDSLTLADDPVVGFAASYTARLQDVARHHGTLLLATAGAVVGLAAISALRHRHAPTELVRR
jgi:cytochrome c biogenesis protein CcdA